MITTLRILIIAALIGSASLLESCNYNPASNPPPTALMTFGKNFHGNYDSFPVDTADKNGSNADIIDRTIRTAITDIVIDTGLQFQSKSHVVKIVSYQGSTPTDTNYFYQDPNGDLYRYNFGFSLLNQFPYLVYAIGSRVDVGWVLAAKMTSATGTKWTARTDSVYVNLAGTYAYLSSQGEMMADTSFLVGSSTIKARHARNTVTAIAAGGPPIGEGGTVIIDSYYSTEIEAVVEDFFRHVQLTGSLLKQQAQGRYKIMTSYTP